MNLASVMTGDSLVIWTAVASFMAGDIVVCGTKASFNAGDNVMIYSAVSSFMAGDIFICSAVGCVIAGVSVVICGFMVYDIVVIWNAIVSFKASDRLSLEVQ